MDRRIDKVHHRDAVEKVEILGAGQLRVYAGEALVIAQHRLSVVIAGDDRPFDAAARDKYGRPRQQRFEVGQRVLMERRIRRVEFIAQIEIRAAPGAESCDA